MRQTRRRALQAILIGGIAIVVPGEQVFGESEAAEINRDARAALERLYAEDPGTAQLGKRAAGILVFPKIVKAGFIFGGQGGKGVLTINGQPRRYYTIAAASFGLQAGAQWFSYVLFFKDQKALEYLDKSDGWAVGSDPNVVVVNKGAGVQINTTTLAKEVVAVPFGQKGLMADLSLQGSKITTYKPKS